VVKNGSEAWALRNAEKRFQRNYLRKPDRLNKDDSVIQIEQKFLAELYI
jgi:hypothetical protein